MDISGILEAEDRLFNEDRADEVEGLLMGAISVALDEQDGGALLSLLNELIGYYRETSRFEDSYKIAEEIENVAGRILPENSIPYATSLLNIATAYRAGGRLDDAMALYKRVEGIYNEILEPDTMLMASLYNNEALLYQELRDFESAKAMLEKALSIVAALGEPYEEAVSRANLAGTCMQLGELEEGREHAQRAISLFEELEVNDGHYAAALSAMGSYHYIKGEFKAGADAFAEAMSVMEVSLGRNAYYERLKENYEACMQEIPDDSINNSGADAKNDAKADTKADAKNDTKACRGIELCRKYYEKYGIPMLEKEFHEYIGKIAIGLVGEGSDCFGLDDELSKDHDWGPSFCMWVSDETYEAIGDKLKAAYNALPDEIDGIKRAGQVQGFGRRGVVKISDFCERLLGTAKTDPEIIRDEIDWTEVSDASLAAFVNGEVWKDEEGCITALRKKLAEGYPENIRLQKLAESCAKFSQSGQYNYLRCIKRGDRITAGIMRADAVREAVRLVYYMNNAYPLHDKWLAKGIEGMALPEAELVINIIESMPADDGAAAVGFEKLGEILAMSMYQRDIISDIDSYLDHHTEELMVKSLYSNETNEQLALHIAKAEFEAFDKVKNEGGRASCQNDWATFGIMRQSQYLTWTREMLLQYLYDFERELRLGHNLITEKYGRMMESTAPEKYNEIKENFPELSDEKKAIIEAVCGIQVGWMEQFAAAYPMLAGQARSIHTYDDHFYNTSYETYLRGEISTYSDKMLELYARFIVGLSQEDKNLAKMTMENSCRLYGYKDLDEAEKFLKL